MSELERHLARLRRGELPAGARLLKESPVRRVLQLDDAILKLYRTPSPRARREAKALREAQRRGIAVPALLGAGADWVAMRLVEGRAAQRCDLELVLRAVERMHGRGMLHGDLHLGNLRRSRDPFAPVILLDLQRSRFMARVPDWARRRELGFLAYSLGEPLPRELQDVARWRDRRARVHLGSRTRRCVIESSRFTRVELGGRRGFRRREVDLEALARRLALATSSGEGSELLKAQGSQRLCRVDAWIFKRHRHARDARAAWLAGSGLEARGIPLARALAWIDRWLVMEDAGPTVSDWVDRELASAPAAHAQDLARALGDLLAQLHRKGIYHADLKANNIAWWPGSVPSLLDYRRVRFDRSLSRERRGENLAQLNAALPDSVGPELRELAFSRYLACAGPLPNAQRLRREVIEESLRRHHRWTGCPRPRSR
ncbi:MAG: lipopolysaccharide kinase InaA family protein [Myxococcota bacterium]